MTNGGRYRQGKRKGSGRGPRDGSGRGPMDGSGPGGGQGGCPPKDYGNTFVPSNEPYGKNVKGILGRRRDRKE